ncbi:HAD family hydrolase [Rarobacter faecitabidus]|uniref:Putative hydrolase of the HAD superfamily n=1 Tax=Rarobacter faecitabidus TaxID=13243 RepID=A0A542ZX74_RARFA|nr:HAD family hydrolase [Rarobacter faecitabidus]TQL64899.1 putative hydrolase of the HAD superfamily [Rarobacter faecitabidus]
MGSFKDEPSVPLRAVIVDIDDTIVDTKGAFAGALSEVARTYLPDLAEARHGEVVALWRRDPNGFYRAFTRGEMGFREQRLARAEQLQSQFGGAGIGTDGFDAWNEVFEAAFQANWRPFADAAPFFAAIAGAGLKLGAVSNADTAYQEKKLEVVGLGGHIQTLVGVDVLGYGKPSPRVFEIACDRLVVAAAETLYVGDELDIDARGARAAGLRGIWLDRPGARRGGPFDEDREAALADGIAVVESLDELAAELSLVPQVRDESTAS